MSAAVQLSNIFSSLFTRSSIWWIFLCVNFCIIRHNFSCESIRCKAFCLDISYSSFYLDLPVYHYRSISKMKFLFLLGCMCIFCPPNRRSRQIIMLVLEIVYSFCSFICSNSLYVLVGFATANLWIVFFWQHSPDSSFSLVCVLQHFILIC